MIIILKVIAVNTIPRKHNVRSFIVDEVLVLLSTNKFNGEIKESLKCMRNNNHASCW